MSERKKIEAVEKSNSVKSAREERLEEVVDTMADLVDEQFTGYLRINFSQGMIGRVEKFEEILKTKKKK